MPVLEEAKGYQWMTRRRDEVGVTGTLAVFLQINYRQLYVSQVCCALLPAIASYGIIGSVRIEL